MMDIKSFLDKLDYCFSLFSFSINNSNWKWFIRLNRKKMYNYVSNGKPDIQYSVIDSKITPTIDQLKNIKINGDTYDLSSLNLFITEIPGNSDDDPEIASMPLNLTVISSEKIKESKYKLLLLREIELKKIIYKNHLQNIKTMCLSSKTPNLQMIEYISLYLDNDGKLVEINRPVMEYIERFKDRIVVVSEKLPILRYSIYTIISEILDKTVKSSKISITYNKLYLNINFTPIDLKFSATFMVYLYRMGKYEINNYDNTVTVSLFHSILPNKKLLVSKTKDIFNGNIIRDVKNIVDDDYDIIFFDEPEDYEILMSMFGTKIPIHSYDDL